MAKKPTERTEVMCPVYEVIKRLCAKSKAGSEFLTHLKNAKMEMLLAVRSLIDRRIEQLREHKPAKPRSRRIKVTEKE